MPQDGHGKGAAGSSHNFPTHDIFFLQAKAETSATRSDWFCGDTKKRWGSAPLYGAVGAIRDLEITL